MRVHDYNVIVLSGAFFVSTILGTPRNSYGEIFLVALILATICVSVAISRRIKSELNRASQTDVTAANKSATLDQLVGRVSILLCLYIPIRNSHEWLAYSRSLGVELFLKRHLQPYLPGATILFLGVQVLMWIGFGESSSESKRLFSILLEQESGRAVVGATLCYLSIWSLSYSLLSVKTLKETK